MSEPWNLPERAVTPENAVLNRRTWLKRLALGGVTAGGLAALGTTYWWYNGGSPEEVLDQGRSEEPPEGIFPAPRNPQFADADRAVTGEADAARYTNFYEFSGQKNVWRVVERFQPRPWTLEITGLVASPRTYDLDDLLRTFSHEERIYRHRCVEAWAMVVPWAGFPLADLLRRAEPLASARFVRFSSFERPSVAPGQTNRRHPWPYTEGLTLAEATNELAFVATGMYGHALLKQHGAPLRIVLPWKYGFKGPKSVVRIELTDHQPATFWNTIAPHEYDFVANVNPDVPHPRWSQKSERMLGTSEVHPTRIYNGYGAWVGKLYT